MMKKEKIGKEQKALNDMVYLAAKYEVSALISTSNPKNGKSMATICGSRGFAVSTVCSVIGPLVEVLDDPHDQQNFLAVLLSVVMDELFKLPDRRGADVMDAELKKWQQKIKEAAGLPEVPDIGKTYVQ